VSALARGAATAPWLLLGLALAASAQDPASRPAEPQGPTLAVLPLHFAPEALQAGSSNDQAAVVRRELSGTSLTGRVVEELVRTRRFRVLERERGAAILRELNLGAHGLSDPKQLPRGKVLAARYLVAGEVRTFRVEVRRRAVPGAAGRVVRSVELEVEIGLRLIDSKTSLLVAAEPLVYTARRPLPGNGKLPTNLLRDLQASIARQLRITVVDAVFPIRVLSLAGEDFLLDRGTGQGLSKGDVLDVFAGKGERRLLGRLEVMEVGPSQSRARLREGRGVAAGDECRRRPRGKGKAKPTSRPKPEGW
jgi:curli production assembly/transport component CsgG